MGINQTGRIIERGDFKTAVFAAVAAYDRKQIKKAYKKSHSFPSLNMALSECTQCHRKMERRIADIQLENKRENAPICIPCIMGYKRKPITENYRSRMSPKAITEFKKYQKTHAPKYKL